MKSNRRTNFYLTFGSRELVKILFAVAVPTAQKTLPVLSKTN